MKAILLSGAEWCVHDG